jgi:CPA2 family monovalent cation:H+ antiporter-2
MHELAPLIHDLSIMLGVAGIVVLLFQRIRQPVVLGYIVAGILIGPYITPHGFVTDIVNIKILSELGVIFLMFSLGLEFSFHKLTKVGFSAVITGIFDVSLMIVFGYFAALYMGWSHNDCLFLGAAVAISSTTIIFKAISELGLKSRRFAEVIYGVLIVEDLLAILLLVGLSTIILKKDVVPLDMFFAAGKLVVVVGAWFLVGYSLVPTLFRRLSTYISQETLTIVSVGLCLFLVSVAAYFHYSTALGAFIMGSILAETVLIKRIEQLIVPIRDIFGAVFFISIGMLINPSIMVQNWREVLFISLVVVCGKIFVIGVGTFLTGQSIKTSVRAGFGMAQIGEFSFIIASLGVSLNATNSILFPIIVAVSSITTFTTPYLIRLSGVIGLFLEKRIPHRIRYFLDSYSTWVYRVQSTAGKNPFLGGVTMRLVANGITVFIIFTLVDKFAFPYIYDFFGGKERSMTISGVLAIILSSPFIWGMIFSYRLSAVTEYANMKFSPIVFVVWLITLIEISLLTIVYFYTWAVTAVFITLGIIFLAIAYKMLEKSYSWFETQLVKNINTTPASHAKYKELAPWDTHFVEMEVGNKSPFINKTLGESKIRERFGVNIVAIYRGHSVIFAPRGDANIQDNDRIIVLGTDDQIERIKRKVILMAQHGEFTPTLDNFVLKPILLDKANELVGKTIRSSKLREKLKGLVVGIERGNKRILNPDPETIIQPDDLLLMVAVSSQ